MNKRIASTLAAVAVAAGTVTAVSTVASPSADAAGCPGYSKFKVIEKAGVYDHRDSETGELEQLLRYKNPGDYVVGGYVGANRYLFVQLGTSDNVGYMRADKTVWSTCA